MTLIMGLSGGLVAVCAFSASAQSSQQTQTYEEYCAPEIVRDYEEPFAKLPKVHGMPEVRLPFGPRAFQVHGVLGISRFGFPETGFFSQVLAGGGEYGYAFSNENYYRSFHLHWTVTAQLRLLDRKGRVGRVVDRQEMRIDRVEHGDELHTILDVPADAGIYRFDIQFADRSGKTLGRFSEYVRVVQPRLKVRLAIPRRSFNHEELVLTRLEDIGTTSIVSAVGFELERFDGSEWIPVPRGLGWLPWEPWGVSARVGWSSDGCSSVFYITPEYPTGRYRVLNEVWPESHRGRAFDMTTEFDIVD